MAVEDAVRRINRTNGAKNTEVNVWEVSECIDEYFKPEPGVAIDPRCGYSDEEWDRVIESAQMALRSLDRRRPDLARPTIANALDCTRRSTPDAALHVLLTGRGIRSPPTLEAFRELISREFSIATVHEDKQTNMYVSFRSKRARSLILVIAPLCLRVWLALQTTPRFFQ